MNVWGWVCVCATPVANRETPGGKLSVKESWLVLFLGCPRVCCADDAMTRLLRCDMIMICFCGGA